MKRLGYTIIFLVITTGLKAQSVLQLRTLYYKASLSASACDTFYNSLKKIRDNTSPVIAGYYSMAAFMECHHSYNPVAKLKYFNEGKIYLEKAIAQASNNVELHFLRFTVQTNLPGFLGYKSNIEDDRSFILRTMISSEFRTSDPDLYNRIYNYFFSCDYISENDKALISKSNNNE